ncbi:MAG: motility protein A [Desulfohalobiaceae bacterium]
MFNKSLAAGMLCFLLFVSAFFLTGQASIYFNATAFIVVSSGTLGAGLLSSGPLRLRRALGFASQAYQEQQGREKELIHSLLYLGQLYRSYGARHAQSTAQKHPIISQALDLIKDGYKTKEIREILSTEATVHARSRQELEKVFRNMSAYAPSFGVAGSVIGLVGLLMGIEETSLILENVPVTLISTLYGIVLANFLLLPAAEKMRQEKERELKQREIILCGALCISKGMDFLKMQRMLNSLVPEPGLRVEDPKTFRHIHTALSKELGSKA